MPENCPVCNSKLVKEQVDYKCVNEECPAIKMQKIIYFASKNCMNIEGLRRKYNKRFNRT